MDWQSFLDNRGIPYVTKGSNVKRGWVNIRCPFCADDPSEHMGINLHGGFACWRNKAHRGRSPERLIAALLGCSIAQAEAIAGTRTSLPTDFLDRVRGHILPAPPGSPRGAVEPLPLFRPFPAAKGASTALPGGVLARPFLAYLAKRKMLPKDPAQLSRDFDMQYCLRGPFGQRIIFLVRSEGQLVGWTGRTIRQDQPLRYKSLSNDPERAAASGLPCAPAPINHFLLWYDRLMKADADTIYLCEGPFDALKVCLLGQSIGVVATCCFTSAPTSSQIEHLHELLPRFRHRFLLLDAGTLPLAMQVQSSLTGLDVRVRLLPKGIKDPALLNDRNFLRP